MSSAPLEVGAAPELELAFAEASELFEITLAALAEDEWDRPTPCGDWTVRDVAGHVVGTLIEISAIVRGEPFSRDASEPGASTGPDLLDAVRTASVSARAALDSADLSTMTEAMHGRRPVGEALRFPVADLAVHAWDVAHGTGQHIVLPDALLAHVVHTCAQVLEHVLRGPGLFGPARPHAADADPTTRLMAWLGRETTS